jgi:glycosyltransferase involved in cell wall biosynthesis
MSRPVLLVASAGVLGGAERVLLDWAGALERPALLGCPPGPLAAAGVAAGLEVKVLAERPLRRRGRSARAALELAGLARELAWLARRLGPRVVVASGRQALVAAAAAPLAGARRLGLLHDLSSAPVARAALRIAGARCDRLVATSHAVAAETGPRAAVIHPGVDAAAWALPHPPPGPPHALWLGALVAWKRPDLALEIAARLPGLRLDLAGAPLPGDSRALVDRLQRRAARPDLAGRVRFLGALADPRPALTEAHCLLHCADREPFGLALVEALAGGRPVAAPAAGGPLEIVTPACGRLYAPGDPDAGAAAVRSLLADAGAPAAARARAAAFDGRAAARRFAAAVESLI